MAGTQRQTTTRLNTTTGDAANRALGDVHQTIFMLVAATMLLVPEPKRMTSDDIDRVFKPIERIVLRHMPAISEVNPDYVDGYLALVGIASYVQRCWWSDITRAKGTLPAAGKPSNGNATGSGISNFIKRDQNSPTQTSIAATESNGSVTGNGTTVTTGDGLTFTDASNAAASLYAMGGQPVG